MRRGLGLLLCALVLATAPPASATPSNTPAPTAGVSGTVFAAARSGNTLFLGGNFGLAGTNVGRVAAVSPTTGALGRTLPGASAGVFDIVVDGAGGYYFGGEFTSFGGLPRSGLAHVLADGTVDPNWNPTANGAVFALLLKDGLLYVGGDFRCLGGDGDGTCGEAGELVRRGVAAIEPDGNVTAFNPGTNDVVTEVVASTDASIFIGGRFNCLGGDGDDICGDVAGEVDRFRIARVTTAGAVSSWNARVRDFSIGGGAVTAIAVGGGSTSGPFVYVGGDFTCVAGLGQGNFEDDDCSDAGEEGRLNAAAFALDDSELSQWAPAPNLGPLDMAISGTQVFLAGSFERLHPGQPGEQARNGLASVPTTAPASTANAWDPKLSDNSVSALRVDGTKVYVGGRFSCVGFNGDGDCNDAGEAKRFAAAAFDTTTAAATSWAPSVDDFPFAIEVGTGEVVLGGSFAIANASERGNVAAINLTTGALLPFNPDLDRAVNEMILSGSTLLLGGTFSCVGFNNDGDCTDAGETVRQGLARVSTAGVVDGWNPISNGAVFDLVLAGTTLYAAGNFTCLGGNGDPTCGEAGETTRRRLAAVSTTTGAPTAWNPVANDDAFVLLHSGSTVFAGGDFTCLGGDGDATCGEAGETTRRRLAALDASSGAPSSFNPAPTSTVETLALDGNTLYAGGLFICVGSNGDSDCNDAGEAARNHAAAFDTTGTGAPLPWNPAADDEVTSLVLAGGKVYAGGKFLCLGGDGDATCGGGSEPAGEVARRRLAALDPVTAAPDAWNPQPNGTVTTLATDGETLFAGGAFTSVTSQPQRGIAVFGGVGFPPAPPAIIATDPTSPANDTKPEVMGKVGAGDPTKVKLYKNGTCSGEPAVTESVAEFTGTGITVQVDSNQTTTFSARATNANGDSACSNAFPYTEDSTAPDTSIVSGPSGATTDRNPSFAFSSNESGGSFACRLDGPGTATGAFAACASPKAFSGLADGNYTFLARATDAAGNVDTSPAGRAFSVGPEIPPEDPGIPGTPGTPGAPFDPPGPTDGNDSLLGTAGNDILCGLLGNDTIDGLGGNDTIFGDACNKTSRASTAQAATDGNDRLIGGDGNDRLFGAGGKDTLTGGKGNDKLSGGAGNDSLKGEAGRDALDGGAGDDKLDGGRDKNTYKGGAGKDSISARNGIKETVDCGKGKDSAKVDRKDKVKGCEKVRRSK